MKTDHALSLDEVQNLILSAHSRPLVTFFLSLEERLLLAQSARKQDIMLYEKEHYPGEERRRLVLAPTNYPMDRLPEERVALLKVSFPTKSLTYAPVSHRDILGSIMALGVKRATIGDIVIEGTVVHVFCTEEIKPYLLQAWRSAKCFEIRPEEEELALAKGFSESEKQTLQIQVASLRLDSIVAKSAGLSKEKAQEMIAGGLVKLNGSVDKKNDRILKEGDRLAIKGIGRITLLGLRGMTHKERIRLAIERTK